MGGNGARWTFALAQRPYRPWAVTGHAGLLRWLRVSSLHGGYRPDLAFPGYSNYIEQRESEVTQPHFSDGKVASGGLSPENCKRVFTVLLETVNTCSRFSDGKVASGGLRRATRNYFQACKTAQQY
jgi:hypothetical protein